jgi:glycosyltransferase involved in cell wall biosynthesis
MKHKQTGSPLLTMNCHEAWLHQLEYLERPFHVVHDLPGRYVKGWDEHVRPIPRHATLCTLAEALRRRAPYDCIVAHNLTDLLDLKSLDAPRILVLHTTIEGRMAQEKRSEFPHEYLDTALKYVELLGVHVVAVSEFKGASWGFFDEVIPFAADPEAYLPWNGQEAAGLRVANQIRLKAQVLRFDLHEAAFAGLPVRLVGFNPDMPGVAPSESWQHLKTLFASHRFFVHTADVKMEDGYNMATLEAMAAGLPVLTNHHPTSPIEHGKSGFVSDDPAELQRYAKILLNDRELAGRMGAAARETVRERFSMRGFASAFASAIKSARSKWRGLARS